MRIGTKHFSDQRARKREVKIVTGWDFERVPIDESSRVSSSDWKKVECAWKYLWREERIILSLMREGKNCVDIAEIMRLYDDGRAQREMYRAIEIAAYYAHNASEIERLEKCKYLHGTERRVVLLFVKRRWRVLDIAKKLNLRYWAVAGMLRRNIPAMLASRNEKKLATLVRECYSTTILRSRCEGERENMDDWRRRALEWLIVRVGKIWYVWGGQDINNGIADCSGLVIEVLKKYGIVPERFRDRPASGLFAHFKERTKYPSKMDLVFYGTRSSIKHVMFYAGEIEGIGKKCVIGMCGGQCDMDEKLARKVGAALWIRPIGYRRDFYRIAKVG